MFFFETYAENKAGRLVQDLFLFFKISLSEVKASGWSLFSIYLDSPQFGMH